MTPVKVDKVEAVLAVLAACGWTHTGAQPTTIAKTYSGGSPVPNALIKMGGRQKMQKEGTQRRATIGPRTVCFFMYDGKDCGGFQNVNTSDLAAIERLGT